jgi:hypothetical protein
VLSGCSIGDVRKSLSEINYSIGKFMDVSHLFKPPTVAILDEAFP